MFEITNGEYVDDTAAGYVTWQVPTGLSDPAMLIAYPWYNYSSYEGDRQSGIVSIGCYHGANYANWDTDTFTWPATGTGDPMAAITGTFTNHFVGGSSLLNANYTWEEIDADSWTATIRKVDDETVEIDGLFWTDCPVYGIVDFSAATITIEAQEYGDYYRFASGSGANDTVVATINADGSITVPDFAMWYYFDGDGWYYYTLGSCTLTK